LPLRVPHPSFLRVGPVSASRNSPCRRSFLRLSRGSPGRSDVVCRRPWGSSVARNPFLPLRVPHPSFLRVGPVSASRNSLCRRSFLRLSPGCSPGRSDVVCRRPWGFSHHHTSRAAKASIHLCRTTRRKLSFRGLPLPEESAFRFRFFGCPTLLALSLRRVASEGWVHWHQPQTS
jgi:hypothetical protein